MLLKLFLSVSMIEIQKQIIKFSHIQIKSNIKISKIWKSHKFIEHINYTICNIIQYLLFHHKVQYIDKKKTKCQKSESAKLRALRPHVPTYFAWLRAHVPCVLTCSRASVPCMPTFHVPTCLVLRAYLLTCQRALRAFRAYVPTCSRAVTINNKSKFSVICFP